MSQEPIRIAIVGGGLAGAAIANALVHLPHLEIHVFESSPDFSERGAAIGLAGNAQRALQQFIPSAMDLLNRAGAVPIQSARVMMGAGVDTGTFVCDLGEGDEPDPNPPLIVSRASLLRELLKPLPREALHADKQVDSIQETSDGVEITFRDDQTVSFDGLIGADGIFGTVRQYVVGKDECTATSTGFWDCRNVIPFDQAVAAFGDEYFKVDREYGWVGDGTFFLHNVIENKTMVQCLMSGVEKEPHSSRVQVLTREILEEKLQGSLDSPMTKNMVDILLDQPRTEAYSSYEHKKTSTYAKGRICIAGDAAHAMSPWQGAGGGQAIEDAMILGSLLSEISSSAETGAAFRALDAVRRPRAQRIIDSSRETGQIMCGQNIDVGLNKDKIKQAVASKWSFILGLDMARHKEDAVRQMRQDQSK